jgi:hypothetical protein
MSLRKSALVWALALFLLFSLAASASSATFGPVSLSDDNGGAFVNDAVITSGSNWLQITLPSYSTSNFDSFFANFVGLSTTVTPNGGTIKSITYSFSGTFSGAGSASFDQYGNALYDTGSFNSSYSGTFDFGPAGVSSVNLVTLLHLDDGGDLAGVDTVQYTVATPEPASLALVGLGFGVLALRRRQHS